MLSAGSPNPRVPLSALLRPEPFPQPPRAAPRLRPPQAAPAALAAASRPLWKGWGEAGVARGGPRHLPSPSWSHPRPPQLPEGGKHWPLLPWRSSPGMGLLWVVLGEQSASQAAPRSDPPSRGPRGPTGDLALHSSLATSSHFLPSSRFCAQGTFGYLSGLLLTILFL